MYIHKIDNKKHADFLAQNRKDPITGDLIIEGNEIVFCKECKSVFLKDTWEYLEGKHCNSKLTLIDFPKTKKLNLGVIEKIDTLHFIIRDIRTNRFEKLGNYLSDIRQWQEVKANFEFNKKILQNEFLEMSVKQTVYKKTNYFLKTWGLLVYFTIWCVLSFTIDGFSHLYMLATGVIYFAIWLDVDGYMLDMDVDRGVKGKHPLLIFRKDSIFVYYDELQKAYTIDYQDIVHFDFFCGLNNVSIATKDGYEVTFVLKNNSNRVQVNFMRIKNIIRRIQKISPTTLIHFEKIPENMKSDIMKLHKANKNTWIEEL